MKTLIIAVLLLVSILGASQVEARGRYGSHRVGGDSHGKGSHYVGGYVRSCHGSACR